MIKFSPCCPLTFELELLLLFLLLVLQINRGSIFILNIRCTILYTSNASNCVRKIIVMNAHEQEAFFYL